MELSLLELAQMHSATQSEFQSKHAAASRAKRIAPWFGLFLFSLVAACAQTGQKGAAKTALNDSNNASSQSGDQNLSAREDDAQQENTAEAPLPTTDQAWLGVDIDESEGQIIIRQVLDNTPAKQAGLEAGDRLVNLDGEPIKSARRFIYDIANCIPGNELSIDIIRQGAARRVMVVLGAKPSSDALTRRQWLGRDAKDWSSATTVQGTDLSLSAAKGHYVILEFWASWCGVCRAMQPVINGWYKKYQARGVEFVTVTPDNVDTTLASISDFNIAYRVLSDADEVVLDSYRIRGVPYVFLIDPQGKVINIVRGYNADDLDALEAMLDSRLSSKP